MSKTIEIAISDDIYQKCLDMAKNIRESYFNDLLKAIDEKWIIEMAVQSNMACILCSMYILEHNFKNRGANDE